MKTAPKCKTKTTMNLVNGDVVLDGNMFAGFTTSTILDVAKSDKATVFVTMKFESGAVATIGYGKNTRWSVITQ